MVAELETEALDGEAAAHLVELFVEVERLAVAGRVVAARAVGSDRWQGEGFRSVAAWMAAKAGTPVGSAIAAMEMVRLLDDLPATAAAFRAGRLSLAQAQEIAEAAVECPAAEEELLDAARQLSLGGLREECRRASEARHLLERLKPHGSVTPLLASAAWSPSACTIPSDGMRMVRGW